MNRRSDPVGQACGFFDPRPGWRANMKLDLAAIHGREKVLAKVRRKAERQQAKTQKSRDQLDPVRQTELQQAEIGFADVFESALEAALEARQWIATGFFWSMAAIPGFVLDVLMSQKIVRQRRHKRPRQYIGGRKREHHGFCQRPEQVAGDAAQPEHRHEGDTY